MSVYELCEADVPGASLHGRDPGMLTVPELKRWLACRGASRRGRKADLVLRVSVSGRNESRILHFREQCSWPKS